MVTMWLVGTATVDVLLPVEPLVALLIGVVLTPTDPVLANSIVAGVLLFRRLPMVFAFRRVVEPLDRPEAALFGGLFGPMGVTAVFYAILAMERTGSELVWAAGSLVVAGSVLAHGATAVPATLRYGRPADDESR